jgi:hypothetical protein
MDLSRLGGTAEEAAAVADREQVGDCVDDDQRDRY